MTKMDHTDAIRLQAAERYVLGEMPEALRSEYEEHYFECAECALEVKSAAGFVDASRELFRQEERARGTVKAESKAPSGWFRWLRPVVAVPVFAALLAVILFQNAVTIPGAKRAAAGEMQIMDTPVTLANTRSEGLTKISARPNTAIPIEFDFTPSRNFAGYVAELQDSDGKVIRQVGIPAAEANKTVHLLLRGIEHGGNYSLVIAGDPTQTGRAVKSDEVQRLAFSVEILP
jgi:hypothetical protein